MLNRFMMTALVLASISGCKKKNDKPADQTAGSATAEMPVASSGSAAAPATAGSAAPATAGSAAAAASGDACPPGAFKPPSGAFCVDPQGFTPGKESNDGTFGSIAFTGPADANGWEAEVDINWGFKASATDYDDRVKVIQDNAKLKGVKLVAQGDLTGVTGKWVISEHSGYKKYDSVAKGKTSNFNCEGNAPEKADVPANVLALCKSLRPLL